MRSRLRFRSLARRCAAALCLILSLAVPARAGELIVGGTGSSGPLVQLLFDAHRKQAPEHTLRLIAPPLGTNGALRALEQGRVHLVMVGRPLAQAEFAKFGQHFDLADTPFVMASRDGQRRGGFSLDELAQVYAGTLGKWDDGAPIRLVLRGEFESDTLLLKDMSGPLAEALKTAKNRPGMAGAVNDLETVTVLAAVHGSLGPTTLGLLTTMNVRLHLFTLNGAAPTIANLKTGKYPWHKRLTVVLPQRPSPEAAAFADFLRSAKAREILLRNDYLPLAP
ncbi:MAG TPA: substrate-binding domain-containing protein [Humidesulfovibrio sp.]|uniref:substrate-binding domain-containing protein n=1 Tax=Humidesulfovibrio sp. TaxID=2910988 RepID=UPI002BD2B273|nr:substrate-binding domain-containing protein [Humidesulfovibrio sp.]HWR03545.1 substrate-binding domain-containing protein [Humidesulfovibrio sp.]